MAKTAVLELQQLRETQRLNGEHLTRSDTLNPAIEKVSWNLVDTDECKISITLKFSTDTSNILPVTTPAAFAMKHQHTSNHRPWFPLGIEETGASFGRPPGKRFSFREMSQI